MKYNIRCVQHKFYKATNRKELRNKYKAIFSEMSTKNFPD